jgi:beta-glucosidase
MEDFTNRTYKDKSVKTSNITDAKLVNDTKKVMGDKPVIVIVDTTNPLVMSEIEPSSSSILISFGLQDQALLDIISGKAEPQALLPMQMPADMATVEQQAEDLPFDLRVYKDAEGHAYNFAFGMNWQGVISDERVDKFK